MKRLFIFACLAARYCFATELKTVMEDGTGVVVKPANFSAVNVAPVAASAVNPASVSNAMNASSIQVKGGLNNGAYGDTNNFVLQALYGASWGRLSTNVLGLYAQIASLGNSAFANTNTMKVFGATNADTLVPAATIGSGFSTNLLAITGSEDSCANGYVFWQGTEYSSILGTACYDILNMIAYFPTPVPHWEIYLDSRGFTAYTNSSADPTATYRLTQAAIDGGFLVPVTVSKAKISFAASNVVVRGTAYVSSLLADGTIETKGRLLVTGDILSNGSLSVNNIAGNTIQGQSFVGDGGGITGIFHDGDNAIINHLEVNSVNLTSDSFLVNDGVNGAPPTSGTPLNLRGGRGGDSDDPQGNGAAGMPMTIKGGDGGASGMETGTPGNGADAQLLGGNAGENRGDSTDAVSGGNSVMESGTGTSGGQSEAHINFTNRMPVKIGGDTTFTTGTIIKVGSTTWTSGNSINGGAIAAGTVTSNGIASVNLGQIQPNITGVLTNNHATAVSIKELVSARGFASTNVSHVPVAVTVGASPFSFTNKTPYALQVWVSDAALYSLSFMGVTVHNSLAGDVPFTIQPTNYFTLTFLSTAPTVNTNAW